MRAWPVAIFTGVLTAVSAAGASAGPFALSTDARWAAEGRSCIDAATSVASCNATFSFVVPPGGGHSGTLEMTATAAATFGTLSTNLRTLPVIGGSVGCCYFESGSAAFTDQLLLTGG